MEMREHLVLMAEYNEWMNGKLYDAAASLAVEEMFADRGAFFGSVYGTLNHLMLGDTTWLKRFAAHPACHAALDPVRALPAPASLDQRTGDFADLWKRRKILDALIREWAAGLDEGDLAHILTYSNTKGVQFARRFSSLVMHFFNHQTHHRGQVTTLLSQAGIDVGSTDLLVLIPQE